MAVVCSAALWAFCVKGQGQQPVKIVSQLSGCDRLCPVRREVGKPPSALLDGHALPQQKGENSSKLVASGKCRAVSSGAASPCPFQTWWAWSAVLGFSAAFSLSRASCPFFCAQYSRSVMRFLAAVQEVDLIELLPVAHLHDFSS